MRNRILFVIGLALAAIVVVVSHSATGSFRGSLLSDQDIAIVLKEDADTNDDGILTAREIRTHLLRIIRGVILGSPVNDINGDGVVSQADTNATIRGFRALLLAVCGNGTTDAGEQCDDGNQIQTDSCTNTCESTTGTTPADICPVPLIARIELRKRPTVLESGGISYEESSNIHTRRIVSQPDGKFITGLVDHDEIWTQRFEATGVGIGLPQLFEDSHFGSPLGIFDVDGNAEGKIAAVWLQPSYPSSPLFRDHEILKARRYQTNSVQVFLHEVEVDVEENSYYLPLKPHIALAENGSFLVTWGGMTSHGGIRARAFDVAGAPVGPSFVVREPSLRDFSHALTVAGEQYIVLFYIDGSNQGLYFKRYSLDGVEQGAAVRVGEFVFDLNDTDEGTFQIAGRDDGSFMIVREFNGRVYGRMYRADGSPSTDQFALSDNDTRQFSPALAWSNNGTVLALWREETRLGNRLLGRLFHETGAPLGPETEISRSESVDPRSLLSLTSASADAHGNFVIEWREDTSVDSTIVAGRFGPGTCSTPNTGDSDYVVDCSPCDQWSDCGSLGDKCYVNPHGTGQCMTSSAAIKDIGFEGPWHSCKGPCLGADTSCTP